MFGMGCICGAERKFWRLPGVYTTAHVPPAEQHFARLRFEDDRKH